MAAHVVELEIGETQRMRRVVSRSNHRVTGKYPSFKKKRMAYWETSIERDAFRRLDADASVLSFQEQPAKIEYEIDGQRHIHYPDILVRYRSRKDFVEVKSDRDANSAKIQEHTAVMQRILAPLGYGYRVWAATEIRVQPRLANDIYLLRYGQHPVPITVLARVKCLFSREPVVSWTALSDTVLGPQSLGTVCRLILDDWFLIDRNLPITPGTAIRFNFAKGAQA